MKIKDDLRSFWKFLRMEFWRSLNLGASLALCLVILTASSLPPAEPEDRARSFTRRFEFDYVGWTVDALLVKLGQSALDAPRLLDQDEQKQVVLKYIELVRETDRTEFEIEKIYAAFGAPDKCQLVTGEGVHRFFADQAISIGRILLLFVINFITLLNLNAKLALISIIVIPFVLAVSIYLFKKVTKAYESYQEQEAILSTTLQENLSGVRVVKAFSRQYYEIEKFEKDNWEKFVRGKKLLIMHSLFWPLSDILCGAQILAGYLVGAIMAINGEITRLFTDRYGNPTLVIENKYYKITLMHGIYTVAVGERVKIGQPIGKESNKGYTTDMQGNLCTGRNCGYHTHLNIFDKRLSRNVDPLKLLEK